MASRQFPGQLLIVISALFATLVLVICQDELPDDVKEEGNVVEPFVEDDGKNISVREGKTINITCSIQNIGELTINWKNGELQIYFGPFYTGQDSEKDRYHLMNKTLIIDKVDRTDNPYYTCYVMGATTAEQKHYVEVQYGPSKIQITPSHLIKNENEKVELTCESDGVPPPTLNWSFNGNKLPRGSTDIKENGKKLVIPRVSAKNIGNYTCTANNGIGNDVHNTSELKVIHSPILKNPNEEKVTTVIGKDVLLSCEHTSYPPANITWHFNNNTYPKQNNNVELMLKNVTPANVGDYECHLMYINKEPVTKKFRLEIEYPPQITTSSNWVHTGEGRTSDITCTVIANPEAEVYWLHNQSEITHISNKKMTKQENKYFLQIKNFKPTDFGTYTCWANNSLGSIQKDITLSGLASPVQIKVSKMKSKEAKIKYSSQSYSPIIMFSLQYRNVSQVEDSKDSKWIDITIPAVQSGYLYENIYYLRDLDLVTEYEIVMRAKNTYGWNEPSKNFLFSLATSAQADEAHSTTNYQQTEEVHKESSIGDHAAISNKELSTGTQENKENGSSSVKSLSAITSFLVFVFAVLCLS